MNNRLAIIPSPQYLNRTKGECLKIHKVHIAFPYGCLLETALSNLAQEQGRQALELTDQAGEADLVLTLKTELWSPEEVAFFHTQKYAKEQGYLLQKKENGPVVIAACTEIGCRYGIMTLLQLLEQPVGTITIQDWPDFKYRGNKWTIWAESGIWSYDFGDGAEAIKQRLLRKLEQNAGYKINAIYADSFGLNTDRFSEYVDIMRFINDKARERGIHLYTGCYGMSYGQQGYGNTYQGKAYLNRTSYPDGEVYECMGTYDAWQISDWDEGIVDYSHKNQEVTARIHGTCLSNDALTEIKIAEMADYVKKTHCGGFYLHNMDAHEMHPELWKARCEYCRKRWPNDDLYARDGAAGAFAEYFSKLAAGIATVKDGAYDASRDFKLWVISPGYLYPVVTGDEDYDVGMKFWAAVSEYLDTDMVTIGFRENFFYHDKNVRRAQAVEAFGFQKDAVVINFSGADGFYDDKLFTVTSALNDMMKGYDGIVCANGNAFQEPLQVFNAEYLWNCENSAFYNLEEKPEDYRSFMKLYRSAVNSAFRPEAIYGEGGMLDVICEKLYGAEIGREMAAVYKVCGEHGEPPIACASSVDLYTGYSKVIFPMRWDHEELTEDAIEEMRIRFRECHRASVKAYELMQEVMGKLYARVSARQEKGMTIQNDTLAGQISDLEWLTECFEMGSKLTALFSEYMDIYAELAADFRKQRPFRDDLAGEIEALRSRVREYRDWVAASPRKPIDRLGGSLVRREDMGEHLEYWTDIMLSSIRTHKRIPDDVRPLASKKWW